MNLSKLKWQYGAALMAAPLACYLYTFLFEHTSFSFEELSSDISVLFWMLLFYPVIEELAFRGFIQELIASKMVKYPSFYFLSTANIITSILFAMIHLVYYPFYWAILVFFPSLIFGYFKDRFQRIMPSIILHSFYNASALLIIGNIKY